MYKFCPADFVYWEVEYTDGTCFREKEGGSYGGIERSKLKKFKLVNQDDNVLFETWPPDGLNGNHLVYRRRISMHNGERAGVILLGWIPKGPAWIVDIANRMLVESAEGFLDGDSNFYPPVPMPGELYFKEHHD